jgi:hypothetical protein
MTKMKWRGEKWPILEPTKYLKALMEVESLKSWLKPLFSLKRTSAGFCEQVPSLLLENQISLQIIIKIFLSDNKVPEGWPAYLPWILIHGI